MISPNMINLTCPNCSGALKITSDMDRFACGYCGTEQIVKREGGTVALELVKKIDQLQTSVDRSNAELAIQRLTREIKELEAEQESLDEISDPVMLKIAGIIGGILAGLVCLFYCPILFWGLLNSSPSSPFLIGATVFILLSLLSLAANAYLKVSVYNRYKAKMDKIDLALDTKTSELKKIKSSLV